MIPVRDYLRESKVVHNRIVVVSCIVTILGILLVLRLGYLQIVQHERFSTLAQNNRINFSALPPVRGLIYDRNGEILAQNIRVFNLEVLPDKVENMEALLHELGQFIELPDPLIEQFRTLLKKRPSFERQTLKANLDEEEAAILAVNQHLYPGVELRARLQRHYPQGDLLSHVIGYVGRISVDDMEKIDNKRYRGLEYIGKSGIEARYESMLLGKSGVNRVETNAHGRVVQDRKSVVRERV